MPRQSLFGLSSLHSLYGLISKRCWNSTIFSMIPCLISQAKLISLQLEWFISLYFMASAFFWWQKTMILDIWPPRPFWMCPRPHSKVPSNDSDSIFLHFWCQNDKEKDSMSSVQTWPQRLKCRLLRLCSVNDWILTFMHKSSSELFINLITCNLRLHDFKYLKFRHPEDMRL